MSNYIKFRYENASIARKLFEAADNSSRHWETVRSGGSSDEVWVNKESLVREPKANEIIGTLASAAKDD